MFDFNILLKCFLLSIFFSTSYSWLLSFFSTMKMTSLQVFVCTSIGTIEVTSKNYMSVNVVEVCSFNPTILHNVNVCIMNDIEKNARRKKYGKFYNSNNNSTLKNHVNTTCKVVKQCTFKLMQTNISSNGGFSVYGYNDGRFIYTKFIIQKVFSFKHFGNPWLTEIIRTKHRQRHNLVCHTHLKLYLINLWQKFQIR